MSILRGYEEMRRSHKWIVPEEYNIAYDVCDKHPRQKLAMIYEGPDGAPREVLWGELQDLSGRWANFLAGRGVACGDRIAVLLPASPEAAAVILAGLRVGAAMVTMSTLWSDDSLGYRLSDCDPRLVLTSRGQMDRQPVAQMDGAVAIEDVHLADLPHEFKTVPTSAEDPALIYYTSGSTGNPKGVVSPHRAFLGHNEFEYCQDLRDGERSYWMGDWAWGVYKLLGPWRLGAVNLVQQTRDRYDPERLLAFLSKHRASNVFLNPTGLRLMSEVTRAAARYPQSFRVCCSANEPLLDTEADWFRTQFGIEILQNYGMTEAYPMVGNYLTMPVKRGSIGKPVPGWDIAILDEDETPVAAGEAGEICLRARSNPQYPLGYWRRPQQSAEDFGGEWFHTKDRAIVDGDGYFWHQGRVDDLIKSSGYRLSPQEIEQVCREVPIVADAAVIGVPDARRGQLVKAYIVLRPGSEANAESARRVKDYVRQHHSAFGYPRRVEFVTSLPTSQSGKLTRGPLRERAAGKEF